MDSAAGFESEVDGDVRQPPMPRGGIEAIYRRLGDMTECQRVGISGAVITSFTVTAEGRAVEVQVQRSLHPACDALVVRAIRQTRWTPGKLNGEATHVSIQRFPIHFRFN